MVAREKPDPIEHSMELAFQPERFIDYRDLDDFVAGLESVAASIRGRIKSQPDRALDLLETFIAGCYERVDEIHDADGFFGDFVQDLFGLWIQARQSAKRDPHETIRVLLEWRERDDWGYCDHIERTAVRSLHRAGLRAFAEIAHELRAKEREEVEPRGDDSSEDASPSASDRWLTGVLRAVYAALRDPVQYLVVAEEAGLTPKDCETLATIHEQRKSPEEALSWVERGLELERKKRWNDERGWDLADMRRALLVKLGRGDEALAAAWRDFEEHPSTFSYETLMKHVPRGRKSEWRAKVVDVSARAGLAEGVTLLLELQEWDLLAARVVKAEPAALEALSHYRTEPAANKLEERHPEAAAQLFRAMALRILAAKKSKYYDAALEHLESTRSCLVRVGLERRWTALVALIRRTHGRKWSFMPEFEELVEHGSLRKAPTFLEAAKQRRARHFRSN